MNSFAVYRRLLLSLALLGLCVPAVAMHGVDHRFTVWGEITFEDGTPAVGTAVHVIVAAGTLRNRVNVDADGWYRKVLVVVDADLGKVFDIKVGRQVRRVEVAFDPTDTTTERGQRVDFVIPRE